MSTTLRIILLVFLVFFTNLKCPAAQINGLDIEDEEDFSEIGEQWDAKSRAIPENLDSRACELDANVFVKSAVNLDISEDDVQQAVAEAQEELQRETEQNKAEDKPQIPSHVNHQAMHYRAKDNPEAELKGLQARVLERTMTKIADKSGLSHEEAGKLLSGFESDFIKRTVCNVKKAKRVRCNWCYPYRTIIGVCNNLYRPYKGATNTPFKRVLFPDYADGISKPRQSSNEFPLPNARLFSFNVFTDENRFSNEVTHMLMTWGQYMDHDVTLGQQPTSIECPSGPTPCTNTGECFGISVPANDPHFPTIGVKCMHMKRDVPAPNSQCQFGPRQQVNTITAFIDASAVYGVNQKQVDDLRDLTSGIGLLKVASSGSASLNLKPLLPSAPEEEVCRTNDKQTKPCFRAGDGRVNENQGLASIHTLFVREHNRIAKTLQRINRRWSGDTIYQEARKIVGAMFQHITYNEFLPLILNSQTRNRFGLNLKRRGFFTGYSRCTDPSIFNSFAGAAFRLHSMIRNSFSRFGKTTRRPSIPTNRFEDPTFLYDRSNGGVDAILRGLVNDSAQNFDRHFAKALTTSLFVGPQIIIDLPAISIQRGREHGLPGYNRFRPLCGLKKAKHFDDLKMEISKSNRKLLAKYYGHVDNIDLTAAGVLETPMSGAAVGPTFSCLIARQFRDLRKGDRFWYERYSRYTGFTADQLRELRKVSLARVICDNSDDIDQLQRHVMAQAGRNNPRVNCRKIPRISLTKWRRIYNY